MTLLKSKTKKRTIYFRLNWMTFHSSIKTVFILKLDAWGTDGEELQIRMPPEAEVSNLVSTSENLYRRLLGNLLVK